MELVKRSCTKSFPDSGAAATWNTRPGLPDLFICQKNQKSGFSCELFQFSKAYEDRTEHVCRLSVNSEDSNIPTGLLAHCVLKVSVSFLLSLLYSFLPGSLRLCLSPSGVCHPHCKHPGLARPQGWPESKAMGGAEGGQMFSTEETGWVWDHHLKAPPSLFPEREREE